MTNPDALTTLVSDVGFPIAIALILLWERHRTVNKLADIVDGNTRTMKELIKEIKTW